jgi:hypothetical protein
MPAPPPRSTPRPTAPPDPPPPLLERLKTFLDWKSAVASLVVIGFVGAQVVASCVTRTEFETARTAGAAEHQALRVETQTLRERVIRTEESMEWVKGALYEIAKATGARAVPPPPPP